MGLLRQTSGRQHVLRETDDPDGILDKGIAGSKDIGGITEFAYTDSNGKTTALTKDGVPAASPPLAHAVNHQDGGSDEISVTDLSGLLADPQTPAAHTHTFLSLTDTPASYAGAGLRLARVNAGATALEFLNPATDFLTQYALLAGRAAGQTLDGGNAGALGLTLRNNSAERNGFKLRGGDGKIEFLNATSMGLVGLAGAGTLTMTLDVIHLTGNSTTKKIRLNPGASGSDSQVTFESAGVARWSVGQDGSDSNAFVVSQSAALGTSNLLRGVPGLLTLTGGKRIAGTAANTFLEMTSGNTVTASAADEGRIRYNKALQRFEKSENGAVFGPLSGTDGQPGTWTQLGKGPTSVANDTEVTVLATQTLAAGEIPVFHYGMKSTPANQQDMTRRAIVDGSGNKTTGLPVKRTDGDWDFKIKQVDGSARDFDWQVLKVTPA